MGKSSVMETIGRFGRLTATEPWATENNPVLDEWTMEYQVVLQTFEKSLRKAEAKLMRLSKAIETKQRHQLRLKGYQLQQDSVVNAIESKLTFRAGLQDSFEKAKEKLEARTKAAEAALSALNLLIGEQKRTETEIRRLKKGIRETKEILRV